MKKQLWFSLVYAFPTVIVLIKPAYAYLDPGTGSILLQGLIAAVAGGMAAVGMYWIKIKNFFSRKKNASSEQIKTK